MNSDDPTRSPLLNPTRIVTALGLCVVVLGGAVFVAWLFTPRTLTLEITQPVGKTVVCHVVVDGRPESHQAVAPVAYRFKAKELRYAVITRDASPPADVTVRMRDQAGTGGAKTDSGVKGFYTADWWGSRSQIRAMTPTHVATMRSSVMAELTVTSESPTDVRTIGDGSRRDTGGSEGNEVQIR